MVPITTRRDVTGSGAHDILPEEEERRLLVHQPQEVQWCGSERGGGWLPAAR